MATVFSVRASAGKGSFSASLSSESPLVVKVGIPAQPQGGRANRALLSWLEGLLGCRVEILSGQASRRKRLAADCSSEHLLQKIRESGRNRK